MSEATNATWMPDAPLLLDQQQVAALLNISERSVRNLIHTKQLPVIHIGRRCLIRRSSIDTLLLKREAKTQQED
ncbi:MAG: helix-turn-helix domain-containing protein [Candidatus Acidiferrales bacterium]